MDINYEELGFKAGIEIHQELNTLKLFCSCHTSIDEKKLISQNVRKLRAVAGETGEIDLASSYEQLRNRSFIYNGYKKESCLVDLDEQPPNEVNPEAFNIALGVAKLYKLKVPDSICVMRKTVTDGSAVSGFQRTMLVGMQSNDSFIETSFGPVKVEQLNLEEDSCKVEKREGSDVVYSLSRLGIPLLEIGTDASIKNPEHVKEVALLLGTTLRSFNVKRGIGTIRQDVNVSIKEGARVEIKGWQDIRKLEQLVVNEVLRQYNLVQIKKELESRGLKSFKKNSKEVTNLFEKTQSAVISELISNGGKVYALVLPKFSGLLKKEICPGKTFGRELSEYAKAYGTKGMIHTDEDIKKYKLENEFSSISKLLDLNSNDLIIIMAEHENIAQKAVDSVYERALYCLEGVPKETRIPNHIDATSSYARPLPGAHRLYPETDIPNIYVDRKKFNSIKLPELVNDKIERFSKEYDLDKALAKELVREGFDFEDFVRQFRKVEPKFIARCLIEIPKEIKKRFDKEIDIEKHFPDILDKLNSSKISKDAVFEILVEFAQGKEVDYPKYFLADEKEIENEIRKIIAENKTLNFNALIGIVMQKLRGKAEGKVIVDIAKRLFNSR